MNLKEAIAQGKLDEFIKEREHYPPCDKERFDRAINALVQTSKSVQETSSQDASER